MRIVQKYGGTSVGSVARIHAVAAQGARARGRRGNQVAVVVSAMGDSTDRLIELAREVCPEPGCARDSTRCSRPARWSRPRCSRWRCARPAAAARSWNALQLPIETTGPAGPRAHRARRLRGLKQDLAAGVVPVVAGFQGRAENGDITTIGRGGSDTTAVALAVALKADECQILTDVDGVYTTDPRMVPEARRLPAVSFEEMLELAGQGSRVLHLRSVEFAARYGMKLRVLSSFEPGPGHTDLRGEPERGSPRRFRHRLQPRRGRDRRQPGAGRGGRRARAARAGRRRRRSRWT